MSMTLDTLLENPVAAAFGAAGLTCQLVWPLFTKRRAMLGVQMGVGANYALQYALLDAWSGSAVCALGASQTLVAFLAGNRPWLRYLGMAFLPVVAVSGIVTWTGIPTLFVLLASALIMIGRLQQDTVRLRQFMLAATPFAMGYDLSVGAAPALAGACVSFIVSVATLRRELRKRAAGKPRPALRVKPNLFLISCEQEAPTAQHTSRALRVRPTQSNFNPNTSKEKSNGNYK